MKHHCLHQAAWVRALLVAIALCGCQLATRAGVADAASAEQPGPQINEQSAPPAMPAEEQPEVLRRGPVHEAFAEPVTLQAEAGFTAPQPPPANIEEVPPADRPQGQQYAWIPGYWSWDAERSGYVLVSACWRVAPPNMSWVPGYWSQARGGWEWIAGFWAPAGVQELEYLPAPPVIDNMEALGSPPSPDTIWVPPCMYWVQGQYVRRPGYWLAAQPDWVWAPSHYVATPRGYVFAEGHWDYALERRGMLFAPVYFPASVHIGLGFTFSPSIVIDVGLLSINLFACPRYSHYYFGDYYDDAYLRIGIYPWFDSRRLHTWYDPIYEHDRWRNHRIEPRWEERERHEYDLRRADKNLRPARTYREQEARLARLPEPQRRALQVAQPISVAVTSRKTPLKFERINTAEQQRISKQATAVRTFRDERNRWESPAAVSKPVPPSKERKDTVPAPADRRQVVPPPVERKDTAPADRRQVVPPPTERKDTAPAPADRRQVVPAPMERKGTAPAPAAQRAPAPAPARDTRVSKPERVKIPSSPIVGRPDAPGAIRQGPPARPVGENKGREVDIRTKAADDSPRKDNDKRGN